MSQFTLFFRCRRRIQLLLEKEKIWAAHFFQLCKRVAVASTNQKNLLIPTLFLISSGHEFDPPDQLIIYYVRYLLLGFYNTSYFYYFRFNCADSRDVKNENLSLIVNS
jgi:hypothetical protein